MSANLGGACQGVTHLFQASKLSVVHTHVSQSVPFLLLQSAVNVLNFSHALYDMKKG